MELTAAEPRRKSLTQLYLNGEAAVKIDTETFLRSGLKPGDELSDEELHELIQASDARRAREKALYLLEHRSLPGSRPGGGGPHGGAGSLKR